MIDARPILNKFLDSSVDYEKLGQAVCAGYKSLFELMESVPALGNFQTGIPQWSHLVRSFVEHAISLAPIEGMHFEFRPNAARNCWHARFHKNGVAWTSHFVGGGDNKRDMARKAICRAELASMTLPMFADDATLPDADDGHAYFQLLHAGYKNIPESIVAMIPSRDQQMIYASMVLPISEPSLAAVEQVKDEMRIKLVNMDQENVEQDSAAG